MPNSVPPSLTPAYDKIDELMLTAGPGVIRDDDLKKGRMYKLGGSRLCGVRPCTAHLSLHLYGLGLHEPDPTGLLVARAPSHLRAEIRNYDEARQVQPLLAKVYAAAAHRLR